VNKSASETGAADTPQLGSHSTNLNSRIIRRSAGDPATGIEATAVELETGAIDVMTT
jgi:hypothetical protein